MICSACQRRVAADRSFCPKCGSAVFVDDGDWRAAKMSELRSLASAAQTALDTGARPAPVRRPPMTAPGVRVRTARPRAQTAAPATGCLGGLVRLALFVGVIYYSGRWLLAIPEVRTLVDAFAAGAFSDSQVTAAVDAVRERVLQFFGGAR